MLFTCSQFGFYDQNGTVVSLMESKIYKNDAIGLKTLDSSGRLKIVTVPGIDHFGWHLNISICDNYILPYLDWFFKFIVYILECNECKWLYKLLSEKNQIK